MKYALIYNPGSKGGTNKKKLNKIQQIFNDKKIDFELFITEELNNAYGYSLNACKENYDVVVAIGGDGTINNVLNGFFNKEGKIFSRSKMAVIYTGTSPDFCKSYNIPINTDKAINTILNNYSKRIKIGKITMCIEFNENNKNKSINEIKTKSVKYFACCANIGLGAALARNANSGIRKLLGDFLGTFICLIKTINNYKSNDFIFIIDGKKKISNRLYNVSIGKTYYIASGIKVKNDLKENDERFYILRVNDIKFSNIVNVLKTIYSGKEIKNNNYLSLSYCNNIEVLGNSQNPEIEFDGDPAGFLPCKIEHSIDTLDLIVDKNYE